MISFSPRAVIFDWDNTLVDSWGAIGEAVNYTREKYGLPVWARKDILENCNRSARDSFPEWFGDKWKDAYKDFYKAFDEARNHHGIIPVAGAEELLSSLQKSKIPALVVSNKSGNYLRKEADHLGWTSFFAAIVGAGDAARDKPDREHAEHALRMAGFKGGAPDILFIGDGDSDIACARSSGCTPLLLGTEETAKKMLVELFAADCYEVMEMLPLTAKQ